MSWEPRSSNASPGSHRAPIQPKELGRKTKSITPNSKSKPTPLPLRRILEQEGQYPSPKQAPTITFSKTEPPGVPKIERSDLPPEKKMNRISSVLALKHFDDSEKRDTVTLNWLKLLSTRGVLSDEIETAQPVTPESVSKTPERKVFFFFKIIFIF